MCAKKPAIMKNSDMRKMCETKDSRPIAVLGELSTIAHSPGGIPGTNDSEAWNTTPRRSANARTKSRAWRRLSVDIMAPYTKSG